MIYLLGFYVNMAPQHAKIFSNASKDCVKIIHWLGSDIMGLSMLQFCVLKKLVQSLNETTTVMFCESEAKQKELAEMGLKTEVLPVLRDISKFSEKSLPKEFAVGVYMPDVNQQIYNQVLMDNIVKNMPDVKFYYFGDKGKNIPNQKNMENLGYVDINEVIEKTTCLLRYTIHDGLPTAPMEFIMSNRFVLTNAEMPFVEKLNGLTDTEGVRKEIIEKIRALKKRVKNGEKPNPDGATYYREYLNEKRIKNKLLSYLK
jgi:hypothetical protein